MAKHRSSIAPEKQFETGDKVPQSNDSSSGETQSFPSSAGETQVFRSESADLVAARVEVLKPKPTHVIVDELYAIGNKEPGEDDEFDCAFAASFAGSDQPKAVRANAIRVLRKRNGIQQVELAFAGLADSDEDIRLQSIEAIHHLYAAKLLPTWLKVRMYLICIAALDSKSFDTKAIARSILIDGQPFGPPIETAVKFLEGDWTQQLRVPTGATALSSEIHEVNWENVKEAISLLRLIPQSSPEADSALANISKFGVPWLANQLEESKSESLASIDWRIQRGLWSIGRDQPNRGTIPELEKPTLEIATPVLAGQKSNARVEDSGNAIEVITRDFDAIVSTPLAELLKVDPNDSSSIERLNRLRSDLLRVALLITQRLDGKPVEVTDDSRKEVIDVLDPPKPSVQLVEALKFSFRDVLTEVLQSPPAQEALVKALVAARKVPSETNPILPGLPTEHQQILSELLKAPAHDIKAAQVIMDQLIGQQLNEPLTRSISNILRRKNWRVRCTKKGCGQPAMLCWRPNERYKNHGFAQFIHSIASSRTANHSGLTVFKDISLLPPRR